MRVAGIATLLAMLVTTEVPAQRTDAHAVARFREKSYAPMLAMQAAPRTPRGRCLSTGKILKTATSATMYFALPIAGFAGLMADDGWRAARWATYAGAGYSYPMTVWMGTRRTCDAYDGLAYVWTPIAAMAGAVAATR